MTDAAEAAGLARTIAAAEIAPYVGEWDGSGVPDSAGAALREAGLLDADLPAVVRVEVARELGRAGLAAALTVVGDEPLQRAAALTGAAQALLDVGMEYARGRSVFGKPLAAFPLQRWFFAGAAGRLAAAEALVRRVAEAADAGTPDATDAAAALPAASAAAWEAAETALQVHGGYGYTDEYPVSRMWREVAAARAAWLGPGVGSAAR